MKKLTFIVILMAALVSCKNLETNESADKYSSRVKLIEGFDKVVYYNYQIIEVDGHEYLAASRGGIVHLESCPCKNK